MGLLCPGARSQQWRVDYVKQQKIFATKVLDFALGLHTPSVKQTDARTGELRQAQLVQGKWQLTYLESTDKTPKAAEVSLPPEAVIDAGFDHYVRSQWATLMAGNNVVFDFASIPHLKAIALRAATKPLSDCDAYEQAQAEQARGRDTGGGELELPAPGRRLGRTRHLAPSRGRQPSRSPARSG